MSHLAEFAEEQPQRIFAALHDICRNCNTFFDFFRGEKRQQKYIILIRHVRVKISDLGKVYAKMQSPPQCWSQHFRELFIDDQLCEGEAHRAGQALCKIAVMSTISVATATIMESFIDDQLCEGEDLRYGQSLCKYEKIHVKVTGTYHISIYCSSI